MSQESVKDTYLNYRIRNKQELEKVSSRIVTVGFIRLFLFVAGACSIYFLWKFGAMYVITAFLVFVIPFVFAVKYDTKLHSRRKYLEKAVQVCNEELSALDYDWSAFDGGKDFADSEHSYSNDLDLFGDKSLFRMLNRTVSPDGRRFLACDMENHPLGKDNIDKRAEAIKELAGMTDFRMEYRIRGLVNRHGLLDMDKLAEWGRSRSVFYTNRFYSVLPALVFFLNMLFVVLAMIDYITYTVPGLFFSGAAIVSFAFSGKISRIQSSYDKRLKSLETYSFLLSMIEKADFRSSNLKKIKDSINTEGKPASMAIHRLDKLMNELDQRNNFIVYFLLNGLFFWEMSQIIRIEKWKAENASKLSAWIKAVADIDVYCSFATYAYNNPDNVYPEILDGDFVCEAKGLGHVMMRRDICVCNDLSIKTSPYFIIITGANMAGKSTYLRTIGVNYLFACLGLPVYAQLMRLAPVRLVTSLRTTDSLMDNESYFFAELKRLKMIIDRLASGEKLFIILDEILKGTNSADKQKGSLALVSQLVGFGTNGIIATHDLMLGTLKERFPENISNFCFEADIKDDELTFSYKMREGIASNMNACFLMNKMGIAVVE